MPVLAAPSVLSLELLARHDPVDGSLRFETSADLLVWSEAEDAVELSSEILDGGRERRVWSMSLPPEQRAGFARAVYQLR